jgi:hypothetical protein
MDKVASMSLNLDKAKEIASKWGWELDELYLYLSDGGGNATDRISAAQTAHAIILELTKR